MIGNYRIGYINSVIGHGICTDNLTSVYSSLIKYLSAAGRSGYCEIYILSRHMTIEDYR